MYVGLSHHLQINSILIGGQFDVRKVLSTENTALELTLFHSVKMNVGRIVLCISRTVG